METKEINYPMSFEEFKERVTYLFLNNGYGNPEEKLEYLNTEEGQEVLESAYSDTCFNYDGMEGVKSPRKDSFNDLLLSSSVVSNLELLY